MQRKRMPVLISDFLMKKKPTHILAYVGVLIALSAIENMFLKFTAFTDVQFSFTIFFSAAIGMIAGPVVGFSICFLGDLIGWLIFPTGIYMFWIGLTTGTFAFIAGLLSITKSRFKIVSYLKVALFCILSFYICTVGINSIGFYIYNKDVVGFSPTVLGYVSEKFGGEQVTFFAYVAYRLFFRGQIYNNLFNYALVFLGYIATDTIPPLKELTRG